LSPFAVLSLALVFSRERLVESTSLATLVTFALVNLSLLRIAMKLDVRGLIDPDGFEYLPRSFARGAICAGLDWIIYLI
jgi:hypothetical protein